MFFKWIFQAQKGRHARVRSGSGAKVNTLRIQHPAGNTSSADRGTPRASHGWLRRKFERLADRRRWKKSRGRYPLETNLLRSDLVSADRRFHSFTPSSVTSALLFIDIVSTGIRVLDTRLTLRLTWPVLSRICDFFSMCIISWKHFAKRLITLLVLIHKHNDDEECLLTCIIHFN